MAIRTAQCVGKWTKKIVIERNIKESDDESGSGERKEQVGTELGQAQLKLGLDFTLIFCTIKI